MNIAIIPARGGSKRIPRKNVKEFCGKPMIVWAIDTARESKLFDHIVVSTDDQEIARIANIHGATTPFLRPLELSDDLTPTVPVVAHAIQECMSLGWNADYVCCIYPCVPFLVVDDLKKSFNIVKTTNSQFIYPVAEYAHPIQRAMRQLKSGQMEFFSPQHELTRTQDHEKSYYDTGQFYWGKASSWLNHKKMHTDGLGMPIPNWRAIDIDNNDDWKRAELIFRSLISDEVR
jgi:pseudaminic acid cytidylyltransferase